MVIIKLKYLAVKLTLRKGGEESGKGQGRLTISECWSAAEIPLHRGLVTINLEDRIQETGDRKQETGNRRQESVSRRK